MNARETDEMADVALGIARKMCADLDAIEAAFARGDVEETMRLLGGFFHCQQNCSVRNSKLKGEHGQATQIRKAPSRAATTERHDLGAAS